MARVKVSMSFDQRRKALVQSMTKHNRTKPVEKAIPLKNKGVSDYLQRLATFQEQSRERSIMVK